MPPTGISSQRFVALLSKPLHVAHANGESNLRMVRVFVKLGEDKCDDHVPFVQEEPSEFDTCSAFHLSREPLTPTATPIVATLRLLQVPSILDRLKSNDGLVAL